MQPEPFVRLRTTMLCLIALFFCLSTAFAQLTPGKIDWNLDTISADAAIKSQNRFKSEMTNLHKKATSQITMSVSKLKEVMDMLAAKEITNVTFLLVSIRKEDTAQYAKRNPGLTNSERNDLIGRQQLVIRIPRSTLTYQSGSKIVNKMPGLLTSLLLVGLSPLDPGLPGANDDLYLGLGTICPPPASCN